ncbi:MAG: cell division protein FtsA [Muribaculaceae bacterium]|nr:cell division protein FtsA [Muribaculaceae bacterium]
MEEKTIIALEIGSSKIKGAIGTVDPSGLLSIKAVEEEKISDIVRYGMIRNVVETAAAVRSVINRLEQREAPRKIERVYVSVGGRSLISEIVDIERRYPSETEITQEIIEQIIEEALHRPLSDRTVTKALLRGIRVDGAPTKRPVGMFGQHLQARLNLLSCRMSLVKNLWQVIETRLGLKCEAVVVRPLAEANLVLTSEEKRLGCMMVDFGAETTSVAIFKDGVLVHLAVLPLGSRNITRDITTLNYLEEKAEELKIAFGNAMPSNDMSGIRPADNIDMNAVNNYVGARAMEILLNVDEQIRQAGLTPENLPAGIVVVGRGSKLNGLCSRLEQLLPGMKVRVGNPDSRVRILDGRIQSSDAVDVISILADAAHNGAKECLSPQPVVTVQQPVQPVQPVQPQKPALAPAPAPAPAATTTYQHPYTGNTRPIAEPQRPVASAPSTTTPTQKAPGQKPTPVTSYNKPETKSPFSRWMNQVRNGVIERVANIFTEEVDDENE